MHYVLCRRRSTAIRLQQQREAFFSAQRNRSTNSATMVEPIIEGDNDDEGDNERQLQEMVLSPTGTETTTCTSTTVNTKATVVITDKQVLEDSVTPTRILAVDHRFLVTSKGQQRHSMSCSAQKNPR